MACFCVVYLQCTKCYDSLLSNRLCCMSSPKSTFCFHSQHLVFTTASAGTYQHAALSGFEHSAARLSWPSFNIPGVSVVLCRHPKVNIMFASTGAFCLMNIGSQQVRWVVEHFILAVHGKRMHSITNCLSSGFMEKWMWCIMSEWLSHANSACMHRAHGKLHLC